MAEPRLSHSASRLSEDIGDVLSAIRRMIAEDDALSSTRDRLQAERDALDTLIQSNAIQEDAGDFLARRYGGDSALARKLAGATDKSAASAVEEGWPLGRSANGADAARPIRVKRHGEMRAEPGNLPAVKGPVAVANDTAPLKLEQRVPQPDEAASAAPKQAGWRSWLRPEPRKSLDNAAKLAIEVTPTPEVQSFQDVVDDDSAFAEAFDWKSRMRPDLPEVVAAPVEAPEATVAEDPQVEAEAETTPPEPEAETVAASDGALVGNASALVGNDAALGDDDAALRDLLRELIQEELQGEMGQRFSSNLRAVIRREVASVIDQHLERL